MDISKKTICNAVFETYTEKNHKHIQKTHELEI